MGITAKELAKILNLSEATVSVALNNKPGVSTETRQRILEAAEQYGYDFTKVSGRKKLNGSIYFVLYHRDGAVIADTPFFSELTDGVRETCAREGLKLNIRYLYADDSLNDQLAAIRDSDCAGVILLATEMKAEDFARFDVLHMPIVLLDGYLRNSPYDSIVINNAQGAGLAVDYLVKHRRTQPGYLRSAYAISNFDERADGFYQAIRAHGMSTSKSLVHRLTPSSDGAYEDMKEILERGEEPASCYFADNDVIAAGAIRAFKRAGYRIPEDIAIVGFDNMSIAGYMDPPLTTVNVPKKYMAEMAVMRLVSLFGADHFVPVRMEVTTNLVKRRSV